MMLEKNNRQIAAVIARWLDKTLPPAKKNGVSPLAEGYRYFAMAARSFQKRALIHFST